MRLSIIGLPQSGATTVFNALTGRHRAPHTFARPGQPSVAVVPVPDRRVDFLARLHKPQKIVFASVEYIEVPGFLSLTAGGVTGNASAAPMVREADACIKVLRAFDSPLAPNPRGSNDPLRDLRDIDAELLALDLGVIEKRVERLRKEVTKPTPELEENRVELAALERCMAAAEAGTPVGDVSLNTHEERLLRGFRFLTRRPCIHVVNISEKDIGSPDALRGLPPENSLAFCARTEEEIEELDEADRAVFLKDLGIAELARDRLIQLSYRVLGLISFLTVGKNETRAWTIREGTTVLEAAGMIHSDMARGFIRADVIPFADLERLGSEREVKAHGLSRLEGRDYIVRDGDIINIRFNV